MATYTWKPAPAADVVIDYTLEKSIDAGETWTALATVVNDTTDALVFNPDTGLFFYVDATPVAKEIVRIRARNATGNGPYSYLYPPITRVEPCNVYGVVVDTLSGRPRPGMQVLIVARDSKKASLIENAGFPSLNAEAGVAVRRRATLYTNNKGHWQVDLLPDQEVAIMIPDAGLMSAFRVPTDVPVLNFRDTNKYRIPMADFADIAGGVGIQVSIP